VLTSGGYPDKYEINKLINIKCNPFIFYAGAKMEHDSLLTSGGRVLSVVNRSSNLKSAIANVYRDIKDVSFDNMYYRKDIGS
jgi:phosphoribosylamine--glycine ligase/phosphoribosylformylglycinamidine synthase